MKGKEIPFESVLIFCLFIYSWAGFTQELLLLAVVQGIGRKRI